MTLLHFFQSLPAVLGVTVFFVFLWVGQSRRWGNNFQDIISRLRNNPTLDVASYKKLSPLTALYVLSKDAEVKAEVNNQDYKLLKLLSVFQAALIVLVFVICAGMVLYSVSVFREDMFRPKPLVIEGIEFKAIEAQADGLLVDLDPIRVVWESRGEEMEVSVLLENIDTKSRTRRKITISSRRFVDFEPKDLRNILHNRNYKGKNRIRALLETSNDTFDSGIVSIFVGLQVKLVVQFLLVQPGKDDRRINLLNASINGWTQKLLSSRPNGILEQYCLKGIFFSKQKSGAEMAQTVDSCKKMSDIRGEVTLNWIDRIDWRKPYRFEYHGPDDPRLVRTQVYR